MSLYPDDPNIPNLLGVAHAFALKNYDEAILCYEKAIKLKPDYAEAYYNLGIIYLELKEYENASTIFKKAIVLETTFSKGYINLGNTFNAIGKHEDAIVNFQKGPAYLERD